MAKQRLIFCVLFIAVLGLGGCAKKPADQLSEHALEKLLEEKASKVELIFNASPGLNPDIGGRPSPLVVRLYELSSVSGFDSIDFFSLADEDTDVLQKDLQAREVMIFQPGETRELMRELQPGTLYVAVFAEYQDFEGATWRALSKVQRGKTTRLLVSLEPLGVSIAPVEE